MKSFWIDLFCGAGGVTEGIQRTKKAKVIACVNHDPLAIASHKQNHPDCLHYTEDIRTLDISRLVAMVVRLRKKYPGCIINLWASLECTNFSKAKGGLPRDADSRTLANDLLRYIDSIKPDFIWIENVEEFMSWGPLNEKGKPVDRRKGADYIRWVNKITSRGYDFDWKILNAADYGAYTSRKRYFAQFAANGLPISWPKPTHAKKPFSDMFGTVEKWKPVKEVLNLEDKGESIFTRKKPLSEKTLARIYYGLIKFVAGGEKEFISKYFSGEPHKRNISVNGPAHALTTIDHHSIVQPDFLIQYNGKPEVYHQSVEQSFKTLTCFECYAKINTVFLDRQFSSGNNSASIEKPCGSLLPVPKTNLVTAEPFIVDTNYNNTGHKINKPSPPIMASRRHYYLLNPQWFNNGTAPIDEPAFTLIARMDKIPPYIICTEEGEAAIVVYETDSEYTQKIKEFMAIYGIVDIKMRMLQVIELLKIQGFKPNYVLLGSQSHQKKFIGNSVPPDLVEALVEHHYDTIMEFRKQAA